MGLTLTKASFSRIFFIYLRWIAVVKQFLSPSPRCYGSVFLLWNHNQWWWRLCPPISGIPINYFDAFPTNRLFHRISSNSFPLLFPFNREFSSNERIFQLFLHIRRVVKKGILFRPCSFVPDSGKCGGSRSDRKFFNDFHMKWAFFSFHCLVSSSTNWTIEWMNYREDESEIVDTKNNNNISTRTFPVAVRQLVGLNGGVASKRQKIRCENNGQQRKPGAVFISIGKMLFHATSVGLSKILDCILRAYHARWTHSFQRRATHTKSYPKHSIFSRFLKSSTKSRFVPIKGTFRTPPTSPITAAPPCLFHPVSQYRSLKAISNIKAEINLHSDVTPLMHPSNHPSTFGNTDPHTHTHTHTYAHSNNHKTLFPNFIYWNCLRWISFGT